MAESMTTTPANPVTVAGLISTSTGLGRTAAVTNLAWILASAGEKVLVIDWAGEAPDYLAPFHIDTLPGTDLLGYRDGLLPGHKAVELRQYAIPIGERRVHWLGVPGGRFTPPTEGDVVAWWKGLHELRYDYVLIDWPTDTSPDPLAGLCDVVAVLFGPSKSAVDDAARIAREVATSTMPYTPVVPVAARFDDRDENRAQRGRELISAAFAATDLHHGAVEIPYVDEADVEEALAVLVDEPGGTVLAAYERLAAAVTGGRIDALVSPSPAARHRFRHRLGLPVPDQVWRIAVVYSVPNRPWADWARQRLVRAGARVTMVPPRAAWPDGETVAGLVVISSPELPESEAVAQIARIIGAASPEQVDVIGIRVPDGAQPRAQSSEPTGRVVIDVGSRSEAEVGGELVTYFGLFDREAREPIRHPGDPHAVRLSNLLPRNESFVGREAELELLRDRMSGARGSGRWVLAGPPGSGTSQLAREYAHRFGYDYDLIWWLSARRSINVRAGLVRLAQAQPQPDTGASVLATLAALTRGTWYPRALLIYDGYEPGGSVASLLPAGSESVDVLITASDAAELTGTETVHIGPFAPGESDSLLCRQVSGLQSADGERIADAVARLPLALGLAAGWLRVTADALRAKGATQLRAAELAAGSFLERFAAIDPDSPALARTLGVVVASLAETTHGRLAVCLAQLCAYLSPDGVGIDLLRSRAVHDQLRELTGADADSLLLDNEELDEVLWTATSYGLFEVNWGSQAWVILHPALQEVLRSAPPWPGLGPVRRDHALRMLAEYAPGETDSSSPDAMARFDELQRHMFASGALESTDDAVRRWGVNHARHLFLHGDGEAWRYAVEIAEEVSARWLAEFGEQDVLRLRLNNQIANLHRALGHSERSGQVDEETQGTLRGTLGLRHRQTLISTRGRAADLRNLGSYLQAYNEDTEAWNGFREILGEDHRHTRMAAYNLATSAYLVGDVNRALQLQQDDYDRLVRLLGPANLEAWTSAARVGLWLRELGDYRAANDLLTTVAREIRREHEPGHPDVLWINWQLAVVQRRLGKAYKTVRDNEATATRYREAYGEDHPNTRGCTLSLAADHHALGHAVRAVELATQCLAGYHRDGPDHPFTALCRLNLAIYLRGNGLLDEAGRQAEAAYRMLADRLGPVHPWALNATVVRASLLAGRGELAAAIELAEPADATCRDLLGTRHPYTRASGENLATMRELAASKADPTGQHWAEMDIDVIPT